MRIRAMAWILAVARVLYLQWILCGGLISDEVVEIVMVGTAGDKFLHDT